MRTNTPNRGNPKSIGSQRLFFTVGITLWIVCPIVADEGVPSVTFEQRNHEVVIRVADQPVASYVFRDTETLRPYFAHVKTLRGTQVTRNHPPIMDKDSEDHKTMHPGIWMAYGDLSGSDFWRNKARIAHVRFVQKPTGGSGIGSFTEEKHYLRSDGNLICREEFRFEIQVQAGGYLLIWDSTFRSDKEFYFGDQEEMGLGVRVATFITEKKGGRLTDSEGREGARAIWSQAARWCDYSGRIENRWAGITVMCHPENFRDSWMHARDYGLIAANPFGRKAMRKGPFSRKRVRKGESLRLQYAMWVHEAESNRLKQILPVYENYVRQAKLLSEQKNVKP